MPIHAVTAALLLNEQDAAGTSGPSTPPQAVLHSLQSL